MLLRVDEISRKDKMEQVRQELLRFRNAVVKHISYVCQIPPQHVTDKQIEDWLELFQ